MSDSALMEKFQQEIWSKVPHREEKDGKVEIVNATPLVDLTADLKECAKTCLLYTSPSPRDRG